jgi:hypothetical protein
MILRPVTPASADGPPWMKLPVGLTNSVQLVVPPLAERARPEILAHVLGDALLVGRGRVLRGDDHGADVASARSVVHHRDLRLAVGAEEVDLVRLAILGETVGEPVREQNRQRHQLVASSLA